MAELSTFTSFKQSEATKTPVFSCPMIRTAGLTSQTFKQNLKKRKLNNIIE